MGLQAFNCGANVIAFTKNNKTYAMTIAWAMMIDYSKVALLMGGQADSNKAIEVGDEVGISSLAKGQEEIGNKIGSTHSSKINKLSLFDHEKDGGAILVKNAKVNMVGRVVKIEETEGDKLVFVKVDHYKQDENKEFAYGYDPSLYK
ncbi:MAG TPA: hypothetical protein DEF61_04250 [Firmicutes bacterium]|nr:hypothetical protein [Bacillota bacterium]